MDVRNASNGVERNRSVLFCENCGPVTDSHTVEREEAIVVRGEPTTAVSLIRICDVCGEEIFDEGLDTANLDRIYDAYRQKHGLISPAEIRSVREIYALSQRSLGALLGFGEVTIHRYESGNLPEEAYSHLLRLLKDPRNMQAIFERQRNRLSLSAQRKLESRLRMLLDEPKSDSGTRPGSRRAHASASERGERAA